MTTNAIAISRNLAVAGLEKSIADAVAEAVVSHSEASHATKADFVELESAVAHSEETNATKLEAAIAHFEETYATKSDFAELRAAIARLEAAIARFAETHATKAEVAELRSEFRSEIRALAVQVKIIMALVVGLVLLHISQMV